MPAQRGPVSLTKAELRIMRVLWDQDRATVGDVAGALDDPRPAYTTVLTILRILERKGIVGREVGRRAHVYFPLITLDDVAHSVIGDLVQSFFSNSRSALALRLMSEEQPSEEELARIKALIAKYESARND